MSTEPISRWTAAETIGPFVVTTVARFDEPWAFSFLPDGRVLVSEKPGKLKLVDVASGKVGDVGGVPAVAYGGQEGLDAVFVTKATNGAHGAQ